MKNYIDFTYSLCGIGLVETEAGELSTPCLNLKAEIPFEPFLRLNPDLKLTEQVANSMTPKLLPDSYYEDDYVFLWGSGQLAQVISIEKDGSSKVRINTTNRVVDWPAFSWTSTTPDLDHAVRYTSLKKIENIMMGGVQGSFDANFADMQPAVRNMILNLVLRLEPGKLPAEERSRFARSYGGVDDDDVVLTAMAMSGDLRILLFNTEPSKLLYAFARAGRLTRLFGTEPRTILDELVARGVSRDNLIRAMMLARAEERTYQIGAVVEKMEELGFDVPREFYGPTKASAEPETRSEPVFDFGVTPPLSPRPSPPLSPAPEPVFDFGVAPPPPPPPAPGGPGAATPSWRTASRQNGVAQQKEEDKAQLQREAQTIRAKREARQLERGEGAAAVQNLLGQTLLARRQSLAEDEDDTDDDADEELPDFLQEAQEVYVDLAEEQFSKTKQSVSEMRDRLDVLGVVMLNDLSRDRAEELLILYGSDKSAFQQMVDERKQARQEKLDEIEQQVRSISEDARNFRLSLKGITETGDEAIELYALSVVDDYKYQKRQAEAARRRRSEGPEPLVRRSGRIAEMQRKLNL